MSMAGSIGLPGAAGPAPVRTPAATGQVWAARPTNRAAYVVLAIVGLLVGAPVVAMVVMSARAGLPGEAGALTLANYVEAYADRTLPGILANTLGFAAGTVAVALFFAVPLVWLVNRTDLPFKGPIFVLMIAGFLVPTFLSAIGWILMFSPEVGLVNQVARGMGFTGVAFSIYNVPGMALVQGLSLVPSSFFMLSAAFRAVDPALEEASQACGASRLRTLLRVSIPLTWPAIAAVMVYTFALAVSLFEVPAIIGWPARILVLSSLIYFAVTPQAGLPSYGLAGAYGMLMLMLGLALAYCYFRIVRETRRYAVVTGRGYRPHLMPLGRWRVPAWAFVAVYLLLQSVIPLLSLLWVSLLPHLQAPSAAAFAQLSFANFLSIPNYVGFGPFLNTAVLVLVAPALSTVLSVAVSWIVVRQRFRFRGVLDSLAFLPQAVPHILFAVALAYIALLLQPILPLYGTLGIIIIAHAVVYLAYGSRTMNGAMVQVHQELEESARVCGSSAFRTLRRVLLPLMAGAAFNAWLWICLLSYREVTMALVLRSSRNVVLSTLVWELWTAGLAPKVGALAVVLAIVLMPLAWFARGLFTQNVDAFRT